MDLQGKETIIKKYEKINTAIKTALTKKYNSTNKTSIKRRKIKIKGDPIIKYDEDGNVVEEILSEEEDDDDNSTESIEAINGEVKGKKK